MFWPRVRLRVPIVRLKRAQALRMVGREEGMVEMGVGWLCWVGGKCSGDLLRLRMRFCRCTIRYAVSLLFEEEVSLPEPWLL